MSKIKLLSKILKIIIFYKTNKETIDSIIDFIEKKINEKLNKKN